MSDLREQGARPADAEGLARELVSALAALATSPPGGLAARGSAASGAPVSLAGPRQILENASRFVAPHLPADAPFRGVKALVLRALRIVTRDQTVFNSALYEALRSALVETEALAAEQAARLKERGDELDALSGRYAAEVPALSERVDRDARRLEERIAAEAAELATEIRAQAAAREEVGRELLASEHRIDVLEGDRDTREKRLSSLEKSAREAAKTVEDVRLMRLELTTVRAGLAAPPAGAAVSGVPATGAGTAPAVHAGIYAQFEETFRGSEAEIRERQRRDVALFAGVPGPIADLGCGRGELLEVLAQAGHEALGCDTNPVMVARAREKGLAVEEADLFAWLAARPDDSLGGVAAYQVIEHLPAAMLVPLVELAARKLARGGRLLFETVNPESVYAMRWFWMDLTHVRPVPAPSMAQLLRAIGLRDVTIDYRSPVPEKDALPPDADPALAPVARLLFGPQDYAVTGVK